MRENSTTTALTQLARESVMMRGLTPHFGVVIVSSGHHRTRNPRSLSRHRQPRRDGFNQNAPLCLEQLRVIELR
jgi:hypothetical protein